MPHSPSTPKVHTPGAFYSALSIGLVVALGSLTLTTRQSPPPAVAEVAPDAGGPSTSGPQALTGAQPREVEQAQQAPLAEPTRPVVNDADPLGRRTAAGGSSGVGGTHLGTSGGGGVGPGAATSGSGGGEGGGEGTGGSGPASDGAGEPTGDTTPVTTTPATSTTTTVTTAPPNATTGTTVPGTTTTTVSGPVKASGKPTISCVGPAGNQRQVEDPQSPPCINTDIDATTNGGNTYSGVTKDTIRVAMVGAGNAEPKLDFGYKDLATFFNTRFDFYGRKIEFVPVKGNGSGADQHSNVGGPAPPSATAGSQEAMARTVAGKNVFASLSLGSTPAPHYYDELARLGVLSVSTSDRITEPKGPYQWTYMPGLPGIVEDLGGWMCQQMGGGSEAVFAGGAEQLKERMVGYVTTDYIDGTTPDHTRLDAILDGCDIDTYDKVQRVKYATGIESPEIQMAAQTAMADLQGAGVTTVVFLGKVASLRPTIMPAANRQAFFPEWVVSSFGHNEFERYVVPGPPDQMSHMFGITHNNQWVPVADLPVEWAIREVNPGHEWPACTGYGFDCPYFWAAWRYPQLLMLASGIQMAGPELTPDSFEAGLQATTFPNPSPGTDAFAARAKAAKVGFSGDHSMLDDASLMWWATQERSNWDGAAGTFCHAGPRYFGRQWPKATQPSVFGLNLPCRPPP